MTKKAKDHVDVMFCAFSNPNRLRILHLLYGEAVALDDLVDILSMPRPTASRHLRYLREAGLVCSRREGGRSWFSLTDPQDSFHKRLIECLANCFEQVPELKRNGRALEKRLLACC
jgi:ArsR family transcriptional regulator